jgi:hypothetical protein
MTGAYLRVKRGDKWCNVEVEHLTHDERREVLARINRGDGLHPWLDVVCDTLAKIEPIFDGLVADGILAREPKP